MRSRLVLLAGLLGLCAALPVSVPGAAEGDATTPIYLDTSYSFAERAADLVARLTPQQRASQLVSSQAPAISTATNPLLTPVFAGQITTSAPVSAGDEAITVESTAGLSPGAVLTFDPDGTDETVTVTTVGSGPSAVRTLVAPANAGDTNIKVNFTFGFTVGHLIRIDPGANQEIRTIQAVGTSGAGGTGITLTAPLALAHAQGAAAQDLGTPTTFTPALVNSYPAGTVVDVSQGIPAYGWWNEALHGVSRESTAPSGNAVTLTNTTSYPIDQSIGASWDPELMYRVASAISDEAREVVRSNKFDLDFYSPTINMQRDPRWGRNDEAYGEDPYLVARIVEQFVNGMEGKDMEGRLLPEGDGFYKTTTTLKHYALNNSEVNRRNGSSDTDDRTLREYYTKAFRDIVESAQPGAIMSSYNRVNGVPASADPYLIDTLMRQTFGLEGYLTGDCDSISAHINPQHHWQPEGFPHPVTVIESLAFALAAGEDAECNAGFTNPSNYRGPAGASATAGGTMNAIGMHIPTPNGIHNVNDLDVSATRLFTNRMKLGEFNPDEQVPWVTAARARVPRGTWVNNNSNGAVTETPERLTLAREAGAKSIVLLKNDETTRKDGSTGPLLPIDVPASGQFKVLVTGFFANNANFYLGGYSSNQGSNGQANMVTPYAGIRDAIHAINPDAQIDFMRGFTGTGTNAGNCCNTVDPAAVAAAADYDYVIVYAGMDQANAGGTTGREDNDRTTIVLPGAEASLIGQVAAVNPNTVAYMETIGPQDVTSFEPGVAAILWSSYLGQRKGEAIADVLLGQYNPSGRTNGIWYQTNDQILSITDYTLRPVGGTGRTYMYYDGPLTYPFGYGLSYSTFTYSNLRLDAHALDANDTLHLDVDVTNTSDVAGDEVVELYVSTPDAPANLERPRKRLVGFDKVFLEPGETKAVRFTIAVPDLAFFDEASGRWVVDNGRYGIQISRSSADADIQLQDFVEVTGAIKPEPSVVTAKPRLADRDLERGISQRLLFPEGVEIDPGLTVAMNDDTLYGFIAPGRSKPFPAGMKLNYTSNRPDVVSVAGNGVIRTIANGAATITTTVTYRGVSASTQFVVRVLSKLDGLEVNGRELRGFDPDVSEYDVILPPGVTEVPQVAATAPTAAVEVTQASAIPGVATVTSTGPDGIVATYHVNFAVAASSDEFDGDTLDPKWMVVRPNEANLGVGDGSLTITPEPGQLTTTTNTARNLVVQPALGDWTLTTKVVLSQRPDAATRQAGLIAYADDDNYLKFDLEATSPTNVQLSTSLEEDLRDGLQTLQILNTTSANDIYPADNTIWLRMAKTGFTYSTFYSLDGDTWVPVWTTGATLRNVKVGVLAYTGTAAAGPLTAAFDFVDVTSPVGQQLEALRDFVGFLNLDNGLTTDLQQHLTDALKKLDRPKDACHQLDVFAAKVIEQAGKPQPKLTAEQAEQLLYVNEIGRQFGC